MSADVQQASPSIGPSFASVPTFCRGAINTTCPPGSQTPKSNEQLIPGEVDRSSLDINNECEQEALSESAFGAAWSNVKRIPSDESQSVSLNSSGSDSFSTSSDPSEYTSSCQSERRSLPRASSFKGSSPRPANLRVTWSPDVRDPPRSSQSHSASGHRNRKYTIGRRHEKRSAKNGKAVKSKKTSNGSGQKIVSCTIVNAPPVDVADPPRPESAATEDGLLPGDVHSELEKGDWVVVGSRNSKQKRGGCTAEDSHQDASSAISNSSKGSGGNQVPPEPPHEESHAVVDPCKEAVCIAPQSPVKVSLEAILRQIVVDRLEGATAMARGEFELGKSLVMASLKTSQEHGFKAEEARCHRLLADTLAGAERLASLEAAVSGLSALGLPFEHAEALLCLAQQKVVYLQLNDNFSPLQHETSISRSQQQQLLSARSDLMLAASLLTRQLASPKFHVTSCAQVSTGRKKGRRSSSSGSGRGGKGTLLRLPELVEEERRATSVVLGSVHELWGRIALALTPGNKAEAEGCLLQAVANMDWRVAHGAEAAVVEVLLSNMKE